MRESSENFLVSWFNANFNFFSGNYEASERVSFFSLNLPQMCPHRKSRKLFFGTAEGKCLHVEQIFACKQHWSIHMFTNECGFRDHIASEAPKRIYSEFSSERKKEILMVKNAGRLLCLVWCSKQIAITKLILHVHPYATFEVIKISQRFRLATCLRVRVSESLPENETSTE